MCEINPKQSAVFRLEVFTSERMTEKRFLKLVAQKLLTMEMLLNEDVHFRFHIHEEPKHGKKVPQNRKTLKEDNISKQPTKSFRQVLEETKGK